jgi:hypothetical protein
MAKKIQTFELHQIGRNEISIPIGSKLLQVTFNNITGPILAHYEINSDIEEEQTSGIYIYKAGEDLAFLGGKITFVNLVKPVDLTYYCYLNESDWY